MGKERGDERSDRERQEREIQKCIQRLNLSLGVFLSPLGDAYCYPPSLIISGRFIGWIFIDWGSGRSLMNGRENGRMKTTE